MIAVRKGRSDDADLIAAFNIAMARETESRELERAVIRAGVEAVLRDAALGVYWLAEVASATDERSGSAARDERRVVGQMLITYEWSDWRNGMFWWIQSVYVAPEARGRGVYSALHERVEADARRTPGVCGLRLYVEGHNDGAQRVYERRGMTATNYRLFETDFLAARRGSAPR